MITLTTSGPKHLAQQVLYFISRRRAVKVRRLRPASSLRRELQFDLLDLVDLILELEYCFDITIPDEVPLVTMGDLADYVMAETGHLPHHWAELRID